MKVFIRSEYFPGTDADDPFDVTATKLSMEWLTNKTANKSLRELIYPTKTVYRSPAEFK